MLSDAGDAVVVSCLKSAVCGSRACPRMHQLGVLDLPSHAYRHQARLRRDYKAGF